MKIEILKSEEVDYELLSDLLMSAFKDQPRSDFQEKKQNHKLSAPELYRKYTRSPLPSFCTIITDKGSYVASNGLLGLELSISNQIFKSQMSCDTAVAPNYRGNGLSKQCLRMITENLDYNSVFFGFPNKSSELIFKKIGWSEWITMSLKFIPYRPKTLKESFKIEKIETFKQLAFESIGINKNSKYLDWRYPQTDISYQKFYGQKDLETFALVVTLIQFKYLKVLTVLELNANSVSSYEAGLEFANSLCIKYGCTGVIIAKSNNKFYQEPFFTISIPGSIQKRKINLMGMITGESLDMQFWESWQFGLGDWDAL